MSMHTFVNKNQRIPQFRSGGETELRTRGAVTKNITVRSAGAETENVHICKQEPEAIEVQVRFRNLTCAHWDQKPNDTTVPVRCRN
jgi:hypothetical protein